MKNLYRLCSPHSLLLVFILFFSLAEQALAQSDTTQKVVTWEFSAQPGADGRPVILLHAHILDGWKLYSTTMPDSLPNSRVALDTSAKATIAGIEEQGKLQSAKDPLFSNALTRFFTGDAQWVVKLQPVGGGSLLGDLKGTVTFMAIRK